MYIYLPPFLHLQKKLTVSTVIFSGRLREIHVFKTDNTRKSFMFVHVSSHCFQCLKLLGFFSFCNTVNFQILYVAQKPTGKSHTSPGKKLAEKKEVSHSSTAFTCRE